MARTPPRAASVAGHAHAHAHAPTTEESPARSRHANDRVFDQLAVAILDGSLEPESSLPPVRVLSDRFGVSRLIVRQAVHRLADIGLVRSRARRAPDPLRPLTALPRQRASKARLRAITGMAEEFADRGAPGAEVVAFEKRFFTALVQRQELYRQLARRLVEDRDAARFYLDSLYPLLDMLGTFVLMGGSTTR
jgi:DNA-binding transcriptional MocR family regulator